MLHPNAASTPTDTSVSIDASAWRTFFQAARWNGQAAQAATGADSANASHCQLRNCSADTIDSSSTGVPSTAASTRRCSRGSLHRSGSPPAVAVPVAAADATGRGGAGRWASYPIDCTVAIRSAGASASGSNSTVAFSVA